MPRDGSSVYSAPAGTTASPNTTIESSKYNALVADLVSDANAARPITAGGTGETSARLKDGTWRYQNTSDTTKLLAFDLSNITTATTRTLTIPNASGTIALAGDVAGKTTDYTVLVTDNGAVITVSASGATRTINLPAAATAGNGFRVIVKKVDTSTNTVTIDADGTETIDGAATYVLRLGYQSVALVCDGTQWRVISDGQIFAIGSESTGNYVRYANGYQVCWFETAAEATTAQADGSIYRSATPGSWTYPAAFSASYPIVGYAAANNGSRWANVFAVGATSLSYRQWAGGTSATGISTYLRAEGRWF